MKRKALYRRFSDFHDLVGDLKIKEDIDSQMKIEDLDEDDITMRLWYSALVKIEINGCKEEEFWSKFAKLKDELVEEISYNFKYATKESALEYLEIVKGVFEDIATSCGNFEQTDTLVKHCIEKGILETELDFNSILYKEKIFDFWYKLTKSIPPILEIIDQSLSGFNKAIRQPKTRKKKPEANKPKMIDSKRDEIPADVVELVGKDHKDIQSKEKEEPKTVYLTTQKVAGLFQVTDKTIHDWRNKGKIAGTKFGRKWLYEKTYIYQLLKDNELLI